MASLPYFEGEGILTNATHPANSEAESGEAYPVSGTANEALSATVVDAGRREVYALVRKRTASPVHDSPSHEMKRYQTLVARAVDVFGDEIKASRWLSLPNRDLDGQTPLQAAEKEAYSLRSIEPLLTRIEHGVYY
jgi:hypothetical protein